MAILVVNSQQNHFFLHGLLLIFACIQTFDCVYIYPVGIGINVFQAKFLRSCLQLLLVTVSLVCSTDTVERRMRFHSNLGLKASPYNAG